MGNIIRKIIGIVMIISSVYFLYMGYQWWNDYESSKNYYKAEQEEVVKEEKGRREWLKLDWEKLQKQGIVAWVYACGGKISYPVCYKKENNKYFLHKNPDGEYSYPGSIFLNGYNNPDLTDKNTTVYGHNMRNGTMFRKIHNYEDNAYYKKHKNFYLYTPSGRYMYKIYQAHSVQDASDIYLPSFSSDKEFSDWLKKWGDSADSKFGKQANVKDRIVNLSTCTSNGKKRLLIQGYLKEFETYEHDQVTRRKDLGYSIDTLNKTTEMPTLAPVTDY